MKTIVIGVIALLISGCTTISYEKTVTTYSDRTVESTKVTRRSIGQEISLTISTNGAIEYRNDGGNKALQEVGKAAVSAAKTGGLVL
jgi:hypothetical protein